MTPTQIESQWPVEVVEAWHWIKTYCRHYAIVGGPDWQTLDELTEKESVTAERHMVVLCLHGLVMFDKRVPKKKPGRCGKPNFLIRPLYDRSNKQ